MQRIEGYGRKLGLLATVSLLPLLLSSVLAQAQNATWVGTGGAPADWNAPGNWSPAFVPAANGTAFFNSSNTTTTSISSGGFITVGGMTFTGAPAYTFIDTNSMALIGAGVVADGASFAPTFNVTGGLFLVNAATAGPSFINITGGGGLSLLNTSNAGSAVITNTGGVIRFEDASNGGTANILNVAGVSQIFFNPTPSALSASAGNATIDNNALVVFQNLSTAGNSTIITRNGATTIFTDQSNGGTSQQIVQNGGTLNFQFNASAGGSTIVNGSSGGGNAIVNFDGTSSAGTAHITNNTSGRVLFSSVAGSSTAANSTIDNFGLLVFGTTSTAGGATIITEAGGQTSFFQNATGGNANIVINSTFANPSANVSLTGLTGPQTFTVGSLAGTGGNAFFNIGANKLVVGSNNLNTTYQGIVFDGGSGGSFEKIGTGTQTVSGPLSYSGTTTILGGTLNFSGNTLQNTSSVLVGPNATLSGNGSITTAGGVTVSGTLAPGGNNPLFIDGNLAFSPTGIYQVSFHNATFIPAFVNGSATLDGTLRVRTDSSGVLFHTNYTVLPAVAPIATQFASVDAPVTLTTNVLYNAGGNNVTLNFSPNLTGAAASFGGNTNQRAVAGALQSSIGSSTSAGGFAPLFALSGGDFLHALSQLSGEVATGAATTSSQSMGSFLGVMLDPTLDARGGLAGSGPALAFDAEASDIAAAYTTKPKAARGSEAFASLGRPPAAVGRTNSWVTGYGGWAKADGDANVGSSTITSRFGGLAAGLDYRPNRNTVVGFAIGGSAGAYGLGNNLGTGDVNMFQAGFYGSVSDGFFYFSGALAYGLSSVSTSRSTTLAAGDLITANYDAHSWNGRLEIGARMGSSFVAVTPFAAYQQQRYYSPAYSERAGGAATPFALSFASTTTDQARSELGAWFESKIPGQGAQALTLRARAAWAHQFSDAPTATAAFASFPAVPFTVTGAQQDRNSLLASAAAEYRMSANLAFTARFDGDFGRNSRGYTGQGGVRFTW